jgi:hypothetical protein
MKEVVTLYLSFSFKMYGFVYRISNKTTKKEISERKRVATLKFLHNSS